MPVPPCPRKQATTLRGPTSRRLVSVIIPCVRNAPLLGEAIESVLAQTHPAVEIVVVDDGSYDETDDVATRFADRIKYIRQRHSGVSSARNAGIRAAAGAFLLFLDSDDLIHPDAVTSLVQAAAGDPGSVAVMGYQRFQLDPSIDGSPPVTAPRGNRFLPWLFVTSYPLHAHLVPRDLIVACGAFDERLERAEDFDLWWRLALRGTAIAPVPLIGAFYRTRPGSVSSDRMRQQLGCAEVVLNVLRRACADSRFMATWGGEMLRMLQAVRRRVVAFDPELPVVAELSNEIRTLKRRGIRVSGPLVLRLLNQLPDAWQEKVELVALKSYRRITGMIFE